MISIRRRISFRKSAVDTFLGKLGKSGIGFMANPCKNFCLYFKQNCVFSHERAKILLTSNEKNYLNYTNITRSQFSLVKN